MRIDLHTHSAISDGTDVPADLIRAAKAAGLDCVALTDHDTTDGWDEARGAAQEAGIGFVGGIEVSARVAGTSVHLLAYGVDPTSTTRLAQRLAQIRVSRDTRAREMVERIGAHYPLTWEAVVQAASSRGTSARSVGRPHIADALITAGVVETRAEAFSSILAKDAPYYVPYESFEASEAIEQIHDAGGVCVGAHLLSASRCTGVRDSHLEELIAAGIDGLEVHHREHTPEQQAFLASLARTHGLAATGGSDYHGRGKPNRIGEYLTDPAQWAALSERIAKSGA